MEGRSDEQLDDLAYEIGVLWGDQLVREARWEWVELCWDDGAAPALPLAKLQVLSGTFAGRELELVKTLTTLGRPGVQVAAITRRAEGYYIVHVESGKTEGFPHVNGMAIGAQARKLQDNDVIQLAGVKMGFFLN